MGRCKLSFFLFVLLVKSCFLHLVQSYTNSPDQSSLLALKSKINISDPTAAVLGANWTQTADLCSWIGVSCSHRHRQRVTALNLSYMGLHGTISPHIGNFSFLISLDLSNNSFSGFLPHEISHLHRLRVLILDFNQLEGQIPPALHHCQNLQIISLKANKFSGGIPEELGLLPKLGQLVLGSNNLEGGIPLSIGNISTLQVLNLADIGLSGSIPSTIFNISSLIFVELSRNRFMGSLPMDLCSHCPNIQFLILFDNQLTGQIPSKFHYCRELVGLYLSDNKFHGSIPREIGRLQKLEYLKIGRNDNLTGLLPGEIFNISSLQSIYLSFNSLSGNFPSTIGPSPPNLKFLALSTNKLSGNIPAYFSNFSDLFCLDIGGNLLSGPIPTSLGNLKLLQHLILGGNQLTGEPGDPQLSFLTALSNCSSLQLLGLAYNPLNGIIPDSIGNLPDSLQSFVAAGSGIKGPLPMGIGSLRNLTKLDLRNNNLTGNLPSTIGSLERLQRLYLDNNNVEGLIPEQLCHLQNLGDLSVSHNQISGSIPNCIGNLIHLQSLDLSSNRFTSSIPVNLWRLESLIFMNLSFNFLGGYLPSDMGTSKVIQNVDLSRNQITGNIPSIIGKFESLSSLNLSRNSFQGPIPQSFGDLKGLDFLDLSYNDLSGTIPMSLEALSLLKYLNLSFNKLSGEIPTGGPFVNFTAESFMENEALCGQPILGVPPCRTGKSRVKYLLLICILLPIASMTVILAALIYKLRQGREINVQIPTSCDMIEGKMMSYQELRLATNDFCETNLLGVGSFGSAYQGMLSDGRIVAVKVLNLQSEVAFKSFITECQVLSTIRHRNLVKVITACSDSKLRALVLQYMSNGNLEKWLHSPNSCFLDLLQRVSITFDVASAVEYLHHGLVEPIVHCDLKPSNVLLDEDMVAHVADFGISKILCQNKHHTQTRTLGTLGYIAPEYGSEGKVSTRGDVYSYGIMLLEMISGKKPTDKMFNEEQSLRQWVNESLPDKITDVVDGGLLSTETGDNAIATQSVLLAIMEVGLECTRELPEERINMKEVVAKLSKIKLVLLKNKGNDA